MRFKHCYLCFNSESPGQGLVVKILYLQHQCGTGSSCNNRNNLYTKKKIITSERYMFSALDHASRGLCQVTRHLAG